MFGSRVGFSGSADHMARRTWPWPFNPCMLLQLIQAMPTGGLLWQRLALHWMQDRLTSWLTKRQRMQEI